MGMGPEYYTQGAGQQALQGDSPVGQLSRLLQQKYAATGGAASPEYQAWLAKMNDNAEHRGFLQSPLGGLALAFSPLAVAGMAGAFAAPAVAGGAGGAGTAAGAAGTAGALGAAAKGAGTLGTLGKLGQAAQIGLGGLNAITGASQQGKSNELLQEALGMARQNYAERAPLRQQAIQSLTGPRPQAPDLSATFQTSNPFAHPVAAGLPGAAPMPGGPAAPSATMPGTPAPNVNPATVRRLPLSVTGAR